MLMGKLLALDLGDQWIGSALSDATRSIARPYTTVTAANLETFLAETLKKEPVDLIVIGYPKTMKGGESNQTRKVIAQKEQLERTFSNVPFVLWDERLSSQRAEAVGRLKAQDKLKSHARAAAFILDSYIMYLQAVANSTE